MSSTSTPKNSEQGTGNREQAAEGSRLVVSVLTPPGVGAIAVLRVAGPGADQVLTRFLRRRGQPIEDRLEANRIVHLDFWEAGEHLDDILVVAGGAEGRRGIDLCAHGGVRVVERMVAALVRAGALLRDCDCESALGWPAESLIEREIWTALAGARTRRAVRFLLQLRTALPAELRRIADQAAINREAAVAALIRLAANARACRHLIRGAGVAIAGPANAGKSTLANRVIGAERTLVSARPGSTLDWVSQETAIRGVSVTLVDTPGYGRHGGELEESAIARGQARASQADMELLVFDGSQPPPAGEVPKASAERPRLLVLNKNDLGTVWTENQIALFSPAAVVAISAKTGADLDTLRAAITEHLGLAPDDGGLIGLFTERQCQLASELAAERDGVRLSTALRAILLGETVPELE